MSVDLSLDRRKFIRLGSAATFFLAVGSKAMARPLRAAITQEIPVASVGFWSGASRSVSRFRSASAPYLVPAQSLLSGDPRFFRAGARIGVWGFWRVEEARPRPASFELDVLYDSEEGKIPFHAWSFRRDASQRGTRGQRLTFDAPVDAMGTLDFVVRRDAAEQLLPFTVNSADAVPLRPGYYFIAFGEGEEPLSIDWTRVRLREGARPGAFDEAGESLLVTEGAFGEPVAVPFNYLVVYVDFPKE